MMNVIAPDRHELLRLMLQKKGIQLGNEKPLRRVSARKPVRASFAQERLWFIQQLQPENTAYNLTGVLRVRGPLQARILERVVGEIVRRHEVLRTVFEPGT